MKNKKRYRITIIVLSLILTVGILWIVLQEDPADPQQIQVSPEVEQVVDVQIMKEETDTVPSVTEEGEEAVEPTQNQSSTAENPEETETIDPTQNEPSATKPNEKPEKPSGPAKPVQNNYGFPYTIADLRIERIDSYDGMFFEDGTDREVSGITAMVLTNTGDQCVEYADIAIDRDGTRLQFTLSSLAPGATAVVLEADGKAYVDGKYSNCTADIATTEEMTLSQDMIRVEELEEGGLLVTNLTNSNIPCVRIFYKFYMQDTGVYVGGITYTAKIDNLTAEGSCTVTPSHYLPGYSKIIMVKTYDSAE